MIQSAALLQRERGVHGTAFSNVLEHSGAPRGSIYHHFPEGRAQLAGEATRWGADVMSAAIDGIVATHDLPGAVRAFGELWISVIEGSDDFTAGCVVAAGALDTDRDSIARREAGDGFVRLEDQLTGALVAAGHEDGAARDVATLVLASFEGALILCRARRTTEPLARVIAQLSELVARPPGPSATTP